MTMLRWTFFVPLAVLAAALTGGAVYLLGNLVGVAWFDAEGLALRVAIGLAASAAFLTVSFKVVPTVNHTVKWLFPGILFLWGALSAIGGLVSFGASAIIPGAVMSCAAIALSAVSLVGVNFQTSN